MARLHLIARSTSSRHHRQVPVRNWWRAKARPGAYLVPIAALCVLVVVAWLWSLPSPAAPGVVAHETDPGSAITVIDGDTVRIDGRTTRLVGFNAPETRQAACAAERYLGDRATSRLRSLVAGRDVTIAGVACACRPGTEGTDACNYGRACAVMRVDGEDVADIMIGEGLAAPFVCRGTRCPPTPRPWCG